MSKYSFAFLLLLPTLLIAQEMKKEVPTQQQTSIDGFKMYPNPAYGDHVFITSSANEKKDIKVYDIFGDLVLSDQIASNTLNIAPLLNGVYVLEVSQGAYTTIKKLVIKD